MPACNEVRDALDETGRISKRVKGTDIGLGCFPDKAVIPHTHLGETIDGPAPDDGS